MPAENRHVTLRFVGEADPDEVHPRLLAAELPRATLRYGPATELLGERVLVVPVAGADDLAAAVAAATVDLGERPRSGFVGHLTLARRRRGAPSASTDVGAPIVVDQSVSEIALVESRLTPAGAVYDTIGRYDLR